MEESTFPDHKIDPAAKDGKWHLQAGKAILYEAMSGDHKMFHRNMGLYKTQTMYGMAKQSIAPYKKNAEIDEDNDVTTMNVSFEPRGPLPKYRDIAISKTLQVRYAPTATPIDITSISNNKGLYAKMKAKIVMRQMLMQSDPEMANSPALMPGPGEPQDLEELEMRFGMGEQFNRAKDAELLICLAFYNNKVERLMRPRILKDLFDHSVAFIKDYLDEKGQPAMRNVDLDYFVTGVCRHPDFNDMWHAGELIPVLREDLSKYFTGEEMETIKRAQENVCPFDKANRTNSVMCGDHKSHALVFDFEFYSWDYAAWETGESKYGNPQIAKSNIAAANKKPEKHISKGVQVLYRCKWVVGTDLVYEYGPEKNQKRSPELKYMGRTDMSFKGMAINFDKMIVSSYMDRLMPLADDYMMNNIRIQNIRNNMVPNGWDIDMGALEAVSLKMGGKDLTPLDLVDLFRKKGILISRSAGIGGNNPNRKSIEAIINEYGTDLLNLYQEKANIREEMKDTLGLNDITDGSTPSDRMLNGVASMSMEATNNALYPLVNAEREILNMMAEAMMFRIQQTIRNTGDYSGFMPAINENTLMFVKADADISLRGYAIMLEARPTEEQKQWVINLMQQAFANKELDMSDVFTVLNTYTTKQAQEILAYRAKKNKELMQQQAIQNTQMTGKVQVESAQAAEQLKQQTMQVEYGLKSQLEAQKGQIQLQLMQMQLQHATMISAGADHTKIEQKHIEKEGKENVARINKDKEQDEPLYEEAGETEEE